MTPGLSSLFWFVAVLALIVVGIYNRLVALRARAGLAGLIVRHRPKVLLLSLPEAAVFCTTPAALAAP